MNLASIKKILIIPFFITCCSCDFRRDIIEEKSIWIKINIDWSDAKISPNGATIYFFPHKRDVKPIILHTNSQIDSVKLYKDSYSVIVINESTTEHDYISFRRTDRYETFEAYAKPIIKNKNNKAIPEKRTYSPDILAASCLDRLDINQTIIEKNKPMIISFKPKQLVKQFSIKANIKGINNVLLDESRISISGVSEGILVATGTPTSTTVTHLSEFNNRKVNFKNFNNGTISSTVNIFNFLSETKEEIKHHVKLFFKLRDGTDHPPITQNLITPQIVNSIAFDLEFPNIKTISPTSGFEVNINNWGETIIINGPTIR